MEINSTEKQENMEKNANELENEQLGKNDSNRMDSMNQNKNITTSNPPNSEETLFSSENKSISAEKPDKNDDQIQNPKSSMINNETKNKFEDSKLKGLQLSSAKKSAKIPHKFQIFLERNEDFQKRKTQNMNELQRNIEDNLKKIMKEKPEITKKSRIIDKKNSKPKFLDRLKDEQMKQIQKKEKLIEKINTEKAKKKEEIEKPLEFNIQRKEDKKFMKIYETMMERQKEVIERFKIFNEVVKEYHMKECTFSPKINKVEDINGIDSDNNNDKNNLTERLVKRMYNDEIKFRKKRKDDLFKKYQPSFQPKINENAEMLSRNWKTKLARRNQSLDYERKNNKNKSIEDEKKLIKSSSKNEVTNDYDKNNNENE